MKVFFLPILFLGFSLSLPAQTNPYTNIEDISRISIRPVDSSKGISYGMNSKTFQQILGNADSVYTFFWEMDEVTATYYEYDNGLQLHTLKEEIVSFNITTDSYILLIDDTPIQVGKAVDTLKVFEKSFGRKTPDGMAITLKYGDHDFLLIGFQEGYIDLISHRHF